VYRVGVHDVLIGLALVILIPAVIAGAWFLVYTAVMLGVWLTLFAGELVGLVRTGRWESWQPEWAERLVERFEPRL
jgi:hypothetical protein